MTVLTIPAAQIATRLRKGDQITALDGLSLSAPVVVASRPQPDGCTRLQAPKGAAERWLYADSHLTSHLTIERAERAPRHPTRTVHGMKLRSNGWGWVSPGGRFRIWDNEGVTVCDLPHPVRTGRSSGYLCSGNHEHTYTAWTVADALAGDDYLDGDFAPTPTMGESVARLVDYLRRHPEESDQLPEGVIGYSQDR